MSRLRFQAESKESKDPIRGNKLLRPYPIEEKIKTTHEENPRDRAVGYAKEQAGTTVTARNVQLPGKVYTQPGCQDEGPPRSDKEKCRICVGRHTHQDTRSKAEVKDNKTLQYFDPQKEITIECDEGLGACLLQDGTPVNFTSRGLIDAETRYCNLEREIFAVAWAVNHYRQYVYGQRCKIVNDHTPLQQIIKKDIRDTSTWLQRLLLRCQGYDFTIEYKKGVEMHISDCLSRCVPSPAPNLGPVFPQTSQIGIFEITTANESDIHKIQSTQKRDPVFQELECLSQEGWPEHHNQVSVLATADWGYRHDIAVIDGNVKSQRSLVPQKMCKRSLQKLHRVHQGVNKSIQRARDTWFWPGMSEQIRRLILACPSFLEPQPRQKKAAVIPVITTNAMQILGCEFSSITVDGTVA